MTKTTKLINKIFEKMIEHENGCPRRVNHFLKVHSFANIIAESENLDDVSKFILEIAAIMHDVGIKASLKKYNSSSGRYQEIEGPPIAEKMLKDLGFSQEIIDRVCLLIANHHSYGIDGIDYQILIEADFLVNIFEDELSKENILNIRNKYFKTQSGKSILDALYLN